MTLRSFLDRSPFVAILRGITPREVAGVGSALHDAGISIVEVPLNEPNALECIRTLVAALGAKMLVGAGTVLSDAQVEGVVRAGGRIVVAPNTDPTVIIAAKTFGVECVAGAITPTECLIALDAGADGLKLFPSEMMPPKMLSSVRAIFPHDTLLLPTGGITPESLAAWKTAGASGFGIGSGFFTPGLTPAEVNTRARAYLDAWNALK